MRHLILLLALALACTTTAQPTWRFHLAFEDGTGARDTIWLVYDTTATIGSNFQPQVDYALGEGDAQIDYSQFNVFTWNWNGDSTKVHAYPYTEFPNFDGTIIDAINWAPPMTITWDTSLFHAAYLPYTQGDIDIAHLGGAYFFLFNNDPAHQAFNMLIDNEVVVGPWTDFLFPFGVNFDAFDDVAIAKISWATTVISCTPNPAQSSILLHPDVPLSEVQLKDISGRLIMSISKLADHQSIDISTLTPGPYFVHARSLQNHLYNGKFIKVD